MQPEASSVFRALCLGGGAGDPRVFSTAALFPSLCAEFRADYAGFESVFNRQIDEALRPLTGSLHPLAVVTGLGGSVVTPDFLRHIHRESVFQAATLQLWYSLKMLNRALDWHGRCVRLRPSGERSVTGMLYLLERDHFRHAEFLLIQRNEPIRVVWNFPEKPGPYDGDVSEEPERWSLGPFEQMPCSVNAILPAASPDVLPLRLPALSYRAINSAVRGRCLLGQLSALPALSSLGGDLLLLTTLYTVDLEEEWTRSMIRHLPCVLQQVEPTLPKSCPFRLPLELYRDTLREALDHRQPVSPRLVLALRSLLPTVTTTVSVPFVRVGGVPDGHPIERLRAFWNQYLYLAPRASRRSPEGFELSLRAFFRPEELARLERLGPALVPLLTRPLNYETAEAVILAHRPERRM